MPAEVTAAEPFEVRVRARNTGNTLWRGDSEDDEMRAVRFRGGESSGWMFNPYFSDRYFSERHFGAVHMIVSHWRRDKTPFLVREKDGEVLTGRGYLGRDVAVGDTGDFVLRLTAPARPGLYRLKLGLGAEYAPLNALAGEWSSSSAVSPSFVVTVK
jgi:hypothetical protein